MKRNDPDEELVLQQRREQMLKLVARGFYNELINYGVRKDEVIKVASHLLDNLMARDHPAGPEVGSYRDIFTLASVRDDWETRRELGVQHVVLRPLDASLVPCVSRWLKSRAVRESFVPAFPVTIGELRRYFADPTRDYFAIFHEGQPVGIVGGENLDRHSGRIEMKKLVGEASARGKGVGKRATFAFLYHAFLTLGLHKVYLHSRDINIRNINLNSRFGFQLEGVFFEELKVGAVHQDVVRMALTRPRFLELFSSAAEPR
ncbi:MAG TPA: GNAT family protein [Methylomirabilota bacterium]|nr:GNAT family protein [Methylomirabilota bacterium]